MLIKYIYHQLPPMCFGVCFTIFRENIALLAQRLYAFCNVALKCKIYPSLIYNDVQCLKPRMHNVESFKIIDAQQANLINSYRNAKNNLLQTNSAVWYKRIYRNSQLTPKRRNTCGIKQCNNIVN
jgi:hypothetical protein